MKKIEHKRKLIIITVIVLIMIIPIIWLSISYLSNLSKYRLVKKYYYSDTEYFNEISSYFKSIYEKGLVSAELDNGILHLKYKTDNKGGEYSYSGYEKDINNESANVSLVELNKKYKSNSKFTHFHLSVLIMMTKEMCCFI